MTLLSFPRDTNTQTMYTVSRKYQVSEYMFLHLYHLISEELTFTKSHVNSCHIYFKFDNNGVLDLLIFEKDI